MHDNYNLSYCCFVFTQIKNVDFCDFYFILHTFNILCLNRVKAQYFSLKHKLETLVSVSSSTHLLLCMQVDWSSMCLCLLESGGLFPSIIIPHFQPLSISSDAATEMTAQQESHRMTQTHTARQSLRQTRGNRAV